MITPGKTNMLTMVAHMDKYDPCTAANEELKMAAPLNNNTDLLLKASLS